MRTMANQNGSGSVIARDWPSGQRPTTPRKTNIRKWLAGLFVQLVRTGEQSLEDGHLGTAAAMFASATLLTDRAETFTHAVQRVYPRYLYRLYEYRMVAMGYGHLFPETATNYTDATNECGRSPAGGFVLQFNQSQELTRRNVRRFNILHCVHTTT